jgi:NADPH:quinone reductase-like Zn-dependent oxidoreductase
LVLCFDAGADSPPTTVTVGDKSLDDALVATRLYDHVVSCTAFGSHSLSPGSLRCVTLSGVFVLLSMLSGEGRAYHDDILREATKLVESGQLKPLLYSHTFRLADGQAAHELPESGKALTKIVIDIV